ncbi:uncharacterized protein LOC115726724 isoform X3 [Rhodamnia argentea]|uniref:Uncharacterized protein LOC115726724 isoform X3 n=1 Tax=Rhodamnia argentea TaxID=178133 RepID=A0ABM3HFP9_9MYRT|nr:uncharacterized protein LOC115726724 isoform X3 [Rhodamnia argentea]
MISQRCSHVQVQALLSELAMVEEEIVWLEGKIKDMKLRLYQEKKYTHEWQMLQQPRRRRQPDRCIEYQAELREHEQPSKMHYLEESRKQKRIGQRRASVGSASDMLSISSTRSSEETIDKSINHVWSSRYHDGMGRENGYVTEKPNELSEKLIKCLISIFLESNRMSQDREGPNHVPKLALACKNSQSSAKSSFGCKISSTFIDGYISSLDPYGVLLDVNGTFRDIGRYKSFIPITRSSLDIVHLQECLPAIGKLRVLVHKLSSVDLSFLTYKQKLAFWINIYNACIMHAFLEHGLPSSQEKLLALMNKAALNVGGIVLNALAIEHFILRHPCESKHVSAKRTGYFSQALETYSSTVLLLVHVSSSSGQIDGYYTLVDLAPVFCIIISEDSSNTTNLSVQKGSMDEKEMLLRHAYGLGYPEPNVTFALCRGSWSSPALRVYTPEDVVNELGRAKVEYLEASVGVTSKRKIAVPKLLQWHMSDFADDMESLLEWIYSQLPRSGTLKRSMMECLNYDAKSRASKMVEIQPYQSEFRYLLAL